jgi:hypothetical protein
VLQLWGLLIGAPSAHFWHAYLQKWFARKADTFDTAIQKVRLVPQQQPGVRICHTAQAGHDFCCSSAVASQPQLHHDGCCRAANMVLHRTHPCRFSSTPKQGQCQSAFLLDSTVYWEWQSAVKQQLMLQRALCKKIPSTYTCGTSLPPTPVPQHLSDIVSCCTVLYCTACRWCWIS